MVDTTHLVEAAHNKGGTTMNRPVQNEIRRGFSSESALSAPWSVHPGWVVGEVTAFFVGNVL
jgi:hypothetical protein